ncbi:MAG: TonB-dependent receptor domain-containing protein [Terriglobia bacterium]
MMLHINTTHREVLRMMTRYSFHTTKPAFGLLAVALCAAMLALFTPSLFYAQVDSGAILGAVKDQSGAVIPGATVTLTSVGTGLILTTKTDSSGNYVFTPIKIGTYTVEARFHGFQKIDHENVQVHVQQQVVVNFTLSPGQVTQTVRVTAAPQQLQTENASVGQVVGSREVNNLPLNGRNYTFLAQLAAGVSQGQEDTRGLGASGSFSANGSRPAQNNYLLDGMDDNANLVDFLNGTAYVVRPPVDAIAEFKVQTSDYSAELGRSAGAVLNATVKSGTNQIHGDVWEFLRNDAFDAANFFENAANESKGEYRQNQFGVTLGGPIRKDKTFFFGDYEGTRIRQAIPWTATVPTALERASGYTNLSELLAQGGTQTDVLARNFPLGSVFDPSTTRAVSCGVADTVTGLAPSSSACPAGTPMGTPAGYVREPFNGNILPAGRLDPNAIRLLNLFPAPTAAGTGSNFGSHPVSRTTVNQFDVRMDNNFSDHDQMFGRVSYSDEPQYLPGPFQGIADGGAFQDGDQTAVSINSVLSETHSFSSTMVNEARLGYTRIGTSRLQPFANNTTNIPGQFGISGIPQVPHNGGLGSIFIAGLNTLGSNQFLPSVEYNSTIQFTDDVTKIQGSQAFKTGFEFQHLKFSILQPPAGRGTWSFNGVYTEVPNQGGGNTGLAQMLLTPIPATVPGGFDYVGGADSINASNYANTDMGRNYYAAYLQDDWKAAPKLMLNLGVRWEYFGQIVEKYGAQSNFLPAGRGSAAQFTLTQERCKTPLSPDFYTAAKVDNVNISCSNLPGLSHSQITNFAPRAGFAYQLTSKLVARGGYGIFYGGFENSVIETYVDFPFQYTLNYSALTAAQPITFANGAIGTLKNGLSPITPLTSAAAEPGGVSFTGEDFHMKTPYTQGYNLTLQYQLTPNQTIQAGYVGNTVRHLGSYINPNGPSELLPPSFNALSYSPYPDFSPSATYTTMAGNSYYNSLQVSFERRFSMGLNTLADFTWSKCRTDAADVLNATAIGYRAPRLANFGIQGDYGLCDFDIPKVVHFSGGYQLPVGNGRRLLRNSHGVVNELLGGWETNWILTLEDGEPFTIPCVSTTAAGFGCNALFVPGQNPIAGPHDVNQWMNPAAFTTPPAVTAVGQTDYAPLGGSPSQLFGPGFHRLDFSLFKRFQTSERTRLEFRAEFFNLTNTPNFSAPGFSGNGVTAAPGSLNYGSPSTFGRIASTRDLQNDQREIQFALKFYW